MRILAGPAVAGAILIWAGTAVRASDGEEIIKDNLKRAADQAFSSWIDNTLARAPRGGGIRNIGLLKLARDSHDFTTRLKDQLAATGNYNVVILSGPEWKGIEEELARTDPYSDWDDLMERAALQWRENRGRPPLIETAIATDALLLGQVLGIDPGPLFSRARFVLNLFRVDTRQPVAGGIREGESRFPLSDLLRYYQVEFHLMLIALLALLVVGTQFPRNFSDYGGNNRVGGEGQSTAFKNRRPRDGTDGRSEQSSATRLSPSRC